jgi:hypothetical protein
MKDRKNEEIEVAKGIKELDKQ